MLQFVMNLWLIFFELKQNNTNCKRNNCYYMSEYVYSMLSKFELQSFKTDVAWC